MAMAAVDVAERMQDGDHAGDLRTGTTQQHGYTRLPGCALRGARHHGQHDGRGHLEGPQIDDHRGRALTGVPVERELDLLDGGEGQLAGQSQCRHAATGVPPGRYVDTHLRTRARVAAYPGHGGNVTGSALLGVVVHGANLLDSD
jgi:hypothetical protein